MLTSRRRAGILCWKSRQPAAGVKTGTCRRPNADGLRPGCCRLASAFAVVGAELHDLVHARSPGFKIASNSGVTTTDGIYLRHIDPLPGQTHPCSASRITEEVPIWTFPYRRLTVMHQYTLNSQPIHEAPESEQARRRMRVLTDVGAILPISDRRKLRREWIIRYIHCATGSSLAQRRAPHPR